MQNEYPNDLGGDDPPSPRASSKGVAMMVELYNKNKGESSSLPDVDEQTLASVDAGMFDSERNGHLSPDSKSKLVCSY